MAISCPRMIKHLKQHLQEKPQGNTDQNLLQYHQKKTEGQGRNCR